MRNSDGRTRSSAGKPIAAQKITPAGSIRVYLKTAVLRESLDQFASHRHIRRFLRIFACHFHSPAPDFGGQEQGGSKLRALLDADAAFPWSWTTAVDESREFLIGAIDPIAQVSQSAKQRRMGPLVHPWQPVNPINALAQPNHCRQKPHGRGGIAS